MSETPERESITREQARFLGELADEIGETAAARRAGLFDARTLVRVIARRPVSAMTLRVVRTALARLEEEQRTTGEQATADGR